MVRFVILLLALTGCASQKHLRLPPEMLKPAAAEAPKTPANSKGYTVRLTDGSHLWEMELPDDGRAYELAVPITEPKLGATMTPADAEFAGTSRGDAQELANGPRRSLLVALDQAQELFRQQRYELALVELMGAEADWPKEARLHAMKGTLYLKLGKVPRARECWQKALALDPTDAATAAALRALPESP